MAFLLIPLRGTVSSLHIRSQEEYACQVLRCRSFGCRYGRVGFGGRWIRLSPSPGGQVSGMAGGSAVARRKVAASRRHPDDLPKGYQLGPGRQAWQLQSRGHHRLPPGTKLIGLRQVDGMAQREPCRSVGANPEQTGANAEVPAVTRQPGVT